MPPKRGESARRRRKSVEGNSMRITSTIKSPQRQTTNMKAEFRIASLIIEVEFLKKVNMSHLIKAHLPEVKTLNIQ
ncbi:unnamed protein product, partial [Rotaria magnacalcarata]